MPVLAAPNTEEDEQMIVGDSEGREKGGYAFFARRGLSSLVTLPYGNAIESLLPITPETKLTRAGILLTFLPSYHFANSRGSYQRV